MDKRSNFFAKCMLLDKMMFLCVHLNCYVGTLIAIISLIHITNQQLLLEVIFLKHTLLVGCSKIT